MAVADDPASNPGRMIPGKAMTGARFSLCILCAEKRNEIKSMQGSRVWINFS